VHASDVQIVGEGTHFIVATTIVRMSSFPFPSCLQSTPVPGSYSQRLRPSPCNIYLQHSARSDRLSSSRVRLRGFDGRSSWVDVVGGGNEARASERAIKLTLPFSVRLRLNSTGALDWDSTIRECRGSRNSDRWRGSFDLLVQCSAMQEQGGSGGSGD